MKKYLQILLTICFCLSGRSFAQSGKDLDALVAAMQKLQSLYTKQAVAFDVKYSYTPESDPARVLEEMEGQTVFDGSRVYSRIDSMETIINGKYRIMLFAEDRIMYVTKDSTHAIGDPSEQLRAVLAQTAITGCVKQESTGRDSYRLAFQPGSPYKELFVEFDQTTNYLVAVRYVIKQELLGEEVAAGQLQAGECAVLNIRFGNFRKPDRPQLFDTAQYFNMEGGIMKVAPAYNEYKIFAGKPNL